MGGKLPPPPVTPPISRRWGKGEWLQTKAVDLNLFFIYLFLASGGGLPLCPEILQYTQWLCLSSEFSTVGDAGFEPGTTASVVWSATNEPPHLHNEPPHLHNEPPCRRTTISVVVCKKSPKGNCIKCANEYVKYNQFNTNCPSLNIW